MIIEYWHIKRGDKNDFINCTSTNWQVDCNKKSSEHVNIESDYRISRYRVDLEPFERLCVLELENAIKDNHKKYIVTDEIL